MGGGGGGGGQGVWERRIEAFVKIQKKNIFFLGGGGGGGGRVGGGGGRGGGGWGSKVWGRWVIRGMGDVSRIKGIDKCK